jgi:pre-rRNA-processing protein RIX1
MLDNLTALRTVTNVIQSLPPKELPQRTQFFVSAISASSAILSSPENHLVTKDGTDRAVLVHKYKTQLSALLNGKSQEGRWIAVVLIKSTIHAGGWEILRGCESWVRGLLGLLNVSTAFLEPNSFNSRYTDKIIETQPTLHEDSRDSYLEQSL